MLKYILPLLVCFYASSYAADGDSLTAYVSAETVKAGQPFEVGIKYSGSKSYTFNRQGFESFTLISGPNSSTQMQMINDITTSSGQKSYIVKSDKPGNYEIGYEVLERDSVIGIFTIRITVLKEPWTKADEDATKKQSATSDPFNNSFFNNQFERSAPAATPAPRAKVKLATISGLEAQFEKYDATLQKEATIKYIITFNEPDANANSIGKVGIAKLPEAKNVYIEVGRNGLISNGAKNADGYSMYIELNARSANRGTYTLTPLIINYNGKKYKSKKVMLVVGGSSGVEI